MGKVLDQREKSITVGEALEYGDAIESFKQLAKGRNYDPIHVQF